MDNYLDLMRARREQILERFYAALDRAGRPHDAARLIACPRPLVSMRPLPPSRRGIAILPRIARRSWFASSQVWRASGAARGALRYDRQPADHKINAVLGSAELIHSVGSLHLAQAISSRAARKIEAGELAGPQRVLIEVNVSGEESRRLFAR
ncbi:MAG: hypothetical protein ACLU0O_10090 [Collinsella sp.]